MISRGAFSMRYIRYIIALQALQGVTLVLHCQKIEFLNSFVSLTPQRYIRYIFTCVRKSNYTALFNNKKIIVRRHKEAAQSALRIGQVGDKMPELWKSSLESKLRKGLWKHF